MKNIKYPLINDSNWIPNGPRQPKNNQLVFALEETGNIILTPFYKANEDHQIDEWSNQENFDIKITHWMPDNFETENFEDKINIKPYNY